MRSRVLSVEVGPDGGFRVRAGATDVVSITATGTARAVNSPERVFDAGDLQYSDAGYGIYRRGPNDFVLYYGPSPKEILEQHQIVTGPQQAPRDASPLPAVSFESWEKAGDLIRLLNRLSLNAVLYPLFDLSTLRGASPEIRQRILDLGAVLPVVERDGVPFDIDRATRAAFTPYLSTYFREAYDRGYPLIRPLLMQFPRDRDADAHSDLFMLGDEFLIAPVVARGDRRAVDLPRGLWTDLRTNTEYRGSQRIEIDAPPGRVPMFARNGSLFPLAGRKRMELHYMPSLGGEFFLWEPASETNSMFHAAPAGDEIRVEVETKVARTYEWVLHHTASPREVSEESGKYRKVDTRSALRPGSWWHDAARNDLHILLRTEAGTDRIVDVLP